MQRPDIVVVVPEETIQYWQWPVRIGCGVVALAIVCLLVFLFVRLSKLGANPGAGKSDEPC